MHFSVGELFPVKELIKTGSLQFVSVQNASVSVHKVPVRRFVRFRNFRDFLDFGMSRIYGIWEVSTYGYTELFIKFGRSVPKDL